MKKSASPCAFPGCSNDAVARGLCHGHYQQQRRGLDLRPLRAYSQGPRKCSVPGCENPVWSKDLCNACGKQFERSGDYVGVRRTLRKQALASACAVKSNGDG